MSRNGAYKPCTWASRISYKNVSPRTSQPHAGMTLPRRARHARPQEYQSDCARNLSSNHLQWVRTSPWNLRAARYHTSEITTTFGVRAPEITTTFGRAHPRTQRLQGHAHPRSRRHSGHAHPRARRLQGHAHP